MKPLAKNALAMPHCLKVMVESYHRRRDIAVEILKANDLFVYSPQGTLYMLIDISKCGMDSHDFAMSLLHERKVAVSPGIAFGPSGKDYIRICFAIADNHLKEGLRRICNHINNLSKE